MIQIKINNKVGHANCHPRLALKTGLALDESMTELDPFSRNLHPMEGWNHNLDGSKGLEGF